METNWKKKYEEALERARALREEAIEKEYVNDYVKDYEAIFPELAESEDEKIRKEIEQTLTMFVADNDSSLHPGAHYTVNEAIAWLEKQKDSPMPEDTVIFQKGVEEGRRLEREDMEKKRLPIIETYQRSWYTEGYYDGKLKKEPRWIIKTQGICTKFEENPKYGQSLEEEQKPAEKQDYSDLNGLERAIHRGFLSAGVENAPVTIIKETAQECLSQMKPAEWSEEDENMMNNIIHVLSTFVGTVECESNPYLSSSYPTYLIEIDWLKSLKNRGNSLKSNTNSPWKPSEEDINAIGQGN